METKEMKARQLRRALQMYVQDNLSDESAMMEVASLYPTWESLLESKRTYPGGTVFRWGENGDGETQLWKFIADYAPQAVYTPDKDISHYVRVGVSADGTPLWTQPFGATDAYSLGDKVRHKEKLWESTTDGNVWEPGVFGWKEAAE